MRASPWRSLAGQPFSDENDFVCRNVPNTAKRSRLTLAAGQVGADARRDAAMPAVEGGSVTVLSTRMARPISSLDSGLVDHQFVDPVIHYPAAHSEDDLIDARSAAERSLRHEQVAIIVEVEGT